MDKNKVLLIRPKNIYGINNYPSLGLLYLATALRAEGFDPVILNEAFCDIKKEIIRHVSCKDVLLIGLTILTSECLNAYKLLQCLNLDSHIPIVVGGWHVTLFPKQMEHSNYVNYVIEGNGELDIVKLAKAVREGRTTPKRVPHEEPDIVNHNVYYGYDPNIESYITSPLTDIGVALYGRKLRWLPYESSRGCPSRCKFCANVVAGRTKWNARPAFHAIFTLNEMSKQYSLNHIKIIDDNFFVNLNRTLEIASGISGNPFTWDAECRADTLSKQGFDFNLFKRSGLTQLTIGIESGSQGSLDLMDKQITLEQAEYAVAKCDEHGIYARCSFIIELPGEWKRDIELTRKFVNRLRRYKYFTCGVQTFRPYPRCELTQGLIGRKLYEEPKVFEDWTVKEHIEIFTKAQMQLPWQIQPERSEKIAAYQCMESAIEIGRHNLEGWSKVWCRCFQWMAKIRNRTGFYGLPLDLWLYRRFAERKKA